MSTRAATDGGSRRSPVADGRQPAFVSDSAAVQNFWIAGLDAADGPPRQVAPFEAAGIGNLLCCRHADAVFREEEQGAVFREEDQGAGPVRG